MDGGPRRQDAFEASEAEALVLLLRSRIAFGAARARLPEVSLDLGGQLVARRHPLLAGERLQACEVLAGVLVLGDRRVQALALGDGIVAQRPEREGHAEPSFDVLEQ